MTVYVVFQTCSHDGEIIEVDSVWARGADAKARCEVIKKESRLPLCYPVDADYLAFELRGSRDHMERD